MAKTTILKGKGKMVSFIEWLDRIGTGALLAEFFSRVFKRGGDAVEKKIEKALGLEIKEGGKGYGDNILAGMAFRRLESSDQKKINGFRDELKKINPKYDKAFILAVAHYVKALQKNRKNTDKSDPKNPKEESYTGYDFSEALKFLDALLLEESFEKKLDFLAREEVFEEFAPEKKPSLAKKKFNEWKEKVEEKAVDFMEKERQQRAVEEERIEKSWDKRFLNRAKERYEESKRRK